MGEYLNRKGYTALGVRLAGHATRPQDMIGSNWSDWTASVEDGYRLLQGAVDRIYLIGLSMGGALSLLMSTRLNVEAVVAISTPYKLAADWRLNFIYLIAKLQPFLSKSSGPPGEGWFDKQAYKDQVSYPRNPVRAIGQLNVLISEMRSVLPQIHQPVLLVHSRDDHYVPPENMEFIFAALAGTSEKKKVYITGSGHVATKDAKRDLVFKTIYDFISRLEASRLQDRARKSGPRGKRGSA